MSYEQDNAVPYITPANKGNSVSFSLLRSAEGKILLTGATLAAIYLAYLAMMFITQPAMAHILIGLTAVELMVGRAAAMAFGYSMFLGHEVVIPVVAVVETIFVLIFYPLFVLSCSQLRVLRPIQRFFNKIHTQAVKRENFVRKYGLLGLFAFVWFPLWMTGPAVGSAIGHLLEMPARRNITAVLGGTYVAIICWGLLLHNFSEQLADYGSYAVMVLTAVIIGAVIAGHLLAKARNIRSRRGRG
jgi:uncharacterized membrane protein